MSAGNGKRETGNRKQETGSSHGIDLANFGLRYRKEVRQGCRFRGRLYMWKHPTSDGGWSIGGDGAGRRAQWHLSGVSDSIIYMLVEV